MAKLNIKTKPIYTAEGAVAQHVSVLQQLKRSVMSCMLWENEFYEDGVAIADRISDLSKKVKPEELADVAITARTRGNLRHVPLLLVRELARKGGSIVGKTLKEVIQRPDELCEFLAIYWKTGKTPLSSQVKRGLASAFRKFNAYSLAKYNRDGAIKLRDVLFLCHAKPKDEEQAAIWKQLVEGTLAAPDTWEVALSAGADKKVTFERLMSEKKLGGLAFLRNLRNMSEAGVAKQAIKDYAENVNVDRILPFRFISAAVHVPKWEDAIEPAMLRAAKGMEKLEGATAILIDHSGSMQQPVSEKSEVSRFDAAAALAILTREICDDVRVFTFSDRCLEVAPRRGFALRDAIKSVINPVGTQLGMAVRTVYKHFPECKRIVVITDEQSQDTPPNPQGTGYVVNVASNRNGLGYGAWTHIDGFSEAVIDFIREYESENKQTASASL